MAARDDGVLPDPGFPVLIASLACDFDSILMASFYEILYKEGLVVIYLDSHFIQVESVPDYNCFNIMVGVDCGASAEVDFVLLNEWLAVLTLDIDAIRVTGDNLVVLDDDLVVLSSLQHNTSRPKVLEVTSLDLNIRVDSDYACCQSIVGRIALKLAAIHLKRGIFQDDDAGNLAIGFSE